MGNLTELYQWLHDEGVYLFDWGLPFSNEKTKSASIRLKDTGTWGIFVDAGRLESRAEERVAMFHEAGHYTTGTTHEVCSPYDLIAKHERRADRWAIQALVTEEELDDAVAAGHTDLWSLAEHFGVTEAFIRKAVCLYTYGNLATEMYF